MNRHDFPALVSSFQEASNEMLAAVLDQSVDCIKVIGPTGTLDFMNRNGRCAMEIDDFTTVAGKNWWDLWPEEAAPLVRDAFERASRGESWRFEGFCPTAKGTPRWWDVSVSPLMRDGRIEGLVSVSRDITERVRAQELRSAAAEEMRHRLQNAYALTSALIMAAARGAPEREEFARDIAARLERLGIAQSLLLDAGRLGKPTLEMLVRRLTEPFCGNGCELEIASLPELELNDQQVRTLALMIGELSTNSNKYGALGRGGSIAISGELEEGLLTLRWSERPSAAIAPVKIEGGGNGFALISRALSAQNGTLDLNWREDGLDVTAAMPGFNAQ